MTTTLDSIATLDLAAVTGGARRPAVIPGEDAFDAFPPPDVLPKAPALKPLKVKAPVQPLRRGR